MHACTSKTCMHAPVNGWALTIVRSPLGSCFRANLMAAAVEKSTVAGTTHRMTTISPEEQGWRQGLHHTGFLRGTLCVHVVWMASGSRRRRCCSTMGFSGRSGRPAKDALRCAWLTLDVALNHAGHNLLNVLRLALDGIAPVRRDSKAHLSCVHVQRQAGCSRNMEGASHQVSSASLPGRPQVRACLGTTSLAPKTWRRCRLT